MTRAWAETDSLKRDLVRDEDLRLTPYRDSEGNLTLGVGRNIDSMGIREDEAMFMLDNDIRRVVIELDAHLPWWRTLTPGAQRGIANMCFNLGWPRLSTFVRMLRALSAGDYRWAAAESRDSKWARQVGDRAERIAALFLET